MNQTQRQFQSPRPAAEVEFSLANDTLIARILGEIDHHSARRLREAIDMEVFRTLPGTLRSDQATHSVAAHGKKAARLTDGHCDYGPRMGIFGDYCFSYSSPWQKMYMENAKIVFIGVPTLYNTFKHFVEYCLVEHYLCRISPIEDKCAAMSEVAVYRQIERGEPRGVWPFHSTEKTDELLKDNGLIRYGHCGNAHLTMIEAKPYVDTVLAAFKAAPESWFDGGFVGWLKKYRCIP